MFNDFRDYLDNLEKNGMLFRVTKEVSPYFEIAAGIRKISDNNGPALLFENVSGYPDWKVVGGLFATRRLLAFALQTKEDENKLLERYLEFGQQRLESVLVSSGPVKEVIIKGDAVDLRKLPIPTYCEKDMGPYLTAGVEIARHPITGIQNASIHRRAILGKDKTSILAAPTGHIGLMLKAAEERGQSLGIATVIGVHPALTIASQVKPLAGIDEMEIGGALRGKPFEVVKCETIDVQVPADAEIVIEGMIVPGEKVADGPFGEYPGNYISLSNFLTSSGDPVSYDPMIKVTAITMRKNPIFQAMLTGMPTTENQILRRWAFAAVIHRLVAQLVPSPQDIRGVNVTAGSAGHHVVISIYKRAESTARNIIYSVLSTRAVVGRVVVVDEDIDIYNPFEVEWAIATRVRPDRDIIILPSVAAQPEAILKIPANMYRWGIDATAPLTKDPWLYKKAVPPGVNKVDYI